MRQTLLLAAVLTAGCGSASNPPGGGDGGGKQDAVGDMAMSAAADLARAPSTDMSLPQALDQGTVGVTGDLAGLVNCYGATVCDPNTSFCIRYYSGSAATPGNIVAGPACFEPADCMGQPMNCNCITQDQNLGGACVNCVDHMDGTYDCYAMQ